MESDQNKGEWAVFRRDDNGNVFLVQPGLSEKFALGIARMYQDRGHKQTYWAEIPKPGQEAVIPAIK